MKRFVIIGAILIALQLMICQSSDAQNFSVEDSSVDTTGAFYFGDEILSPGLPSPGFVLGSGAGLPFGFPVEVDGFSYGRHFMINPQNPFPARLDFSVDASSTGIPGTGVFVEATAGAGEQNYDVYRTTIPGGNFQIHDGNGVIPGGTAMPALGMAEGPAQPALANPFVPGVDGYDSRSAPGPDIYWTWDPLSPLPPPPGTVSGADIMISPSASGYALFGGIYAPSFALGLDMSTMFGPDNVDALEVFDFGVIGVFDTPDVIFFSLDASSGSLFDMATPYFGASTADIFIVTGGGMFGTIPAGALGLLPSDNLTALSISIPEPSSTLICLVAFGLATARRRRRI